MKLVLRLTDRRFYDLSPFCDVQIIRDNATGAECLFAGTEESRSAVLIAFMVEEHIDKALDAIGVALAEDMPLADLRGTTREPLQEELEIMELDAKKFAGVSLEPIGPQNVDPEKPPP